MLNALFFKKWLSQSFLTWLLLHHAVAKTTLPWQCPMFLCFSFLISHSYWSSGHLSLPTDSHQYGDLHLTQLPPDISNPSSPRPCSCSSTESFDVLFLTLLEGSGGRAVGHCVWSLGSVQWCPGLHIHSPRPRWFIQSTFPSCKSHSQHVPYTSEPL